VFSIIFAFKLKIAFITSLSKTKCHAYNMGFPKQAFDMSKVA
jgi:hypothetical protein